MPAPRHAITGLLTIALSLHLSYAVPTHAQEIHKTEHPSPHRQRNSQFAALLDQYKLQTVGAAVLKNGEIQWQGYFGEQRPGIPADADTLFNVASITKTVTAETILRLVDAGPLALDESMTRYWLDPDITADHRHEDLTPRHALNHTTGFPNWRFFTPNRKLQFLHAPGTTFGYSGEGFEYLARYAEHKLGADFPALVQTQVFQPLGITKAGFTIDKANFPHIARAVDADGTFHGHYCRPNGYCRMSGDYSAADDLVISVSDYAKFLVAAAEHQGYNTALAQERNRVQTDKGPHAVVDCNNPELVCPRAQGYGLGWEVVDYGERTLIGHGGSDWSELALAYIDIHSKDGLIIFINALNQRALAAMPDMIRLLEPQSPYIQLYQRRHQAAQANQ